MAQRSREGHIVFLLVVGLLLLGSALVVQKLHRSL